MAHLNKSFGVVHQMFSAMKLGMHQIFKNHESWPHQM